MASILFGFATALVYGFADFFGAIASKRIRSVTVTFFSALAGLTFLASIAPLLQTRFSLEAVLWGIAAGLISAVAMNSLYAALALGPISIVSPMSAVLSALVPALVGLSHGESFSGWGYLALMAILVAVALVGFVPGEAVRLPSGKALIFALIAGTGIGLVMVCLSAAPHDSGIATVVVLRSVSSLVLGISTLVSFRRQPNPGELKAGAAIWISIALAGIFDSSANVFFTLGARTGSLTVVSVLEALYPLGTIVLARVVLKEKIAGVQLVGILLALAASSLLAFKP